MASVLFCLVAVRDASCWLCLLLFVVGREDGEGTLLPDLHQDKQSTKTV